MPETSPPSLSPQHRIVGVDQHTPPEPNSPSRLPTPTPTPNPSVQTIVEIAQEEELGKLVINIAVPVAITLLLTSNENFEKLLLIHAILTGLMIGCVVILNGILFKKEFPRLANILEQLGIILVWLCLYGLAASFLPRCFSWLIWVSGGLCLLPFIYARIQRPSAAPGA